MLPVYSLGPEDPLQAAPHQPGIFKYRGLLPLKADTVPISLGEGSTPLVPADRLATHAGVGRLLFKDETRNPTWSYKDRLAAVAVSVAAADGADTVALASTGNHGAAAAAYAAFAGLRCVVLTMDSVPRTMKVLMQSLGAEVVALRSIAARWQLLGEAVAEWGWVPLSGFLNPPVGSNPFGIDGYKTISYEIWEELHDVPDAVVVPTAYGDGLAGIERGFRDLVTLGLSSRVPRLVAVDPFGAYASALSHGGDNPEQVAIERSVAFSVATPFATLQGLSAIRRTAGTAVAQPSDAITIDAQRRIASSCGLFLEMSSALCLPAVEELTKRGELSAHDTVVCIATSTGLKDLGAVDGLDDVPVIDPTLSDLDGALRR